jgi:hypothetical protein
MRQQQPRCRQSAGGDRDRDCDCTGERGAGNTLMPSPLLPMLFPSGKGPAKEQKELVVNLVREDGPEECW